ncbi:hypothetical protein R9C00_20735 [Flammeovirgaceae bacterium SG7u.111]|nr:hypothetical protein [Flammeovirgaceae bacterium SG7u.132]WPO34129.1 hypothetical protein R9C00_20735 [Flammeovirgaceae bacterium SG7u.111]
MDNSKPTKRYILLNIIGFIATIVLNGLANALPLNGKTTGELSDAYPNLFVPAGFTFSIWGIIYLLLLIFIVYQISLLTKKKVDTANFIGKIGGWFFISSLANASWIVAWHYEQVEISLLIMLVLLVSLIKIYRSLKIGVSNVPQKEKWMVHVPFSVYLGWITIATIANTTALLVDLGWDGFGIDQQYWASIMIGAGIIIALLMVVRRKDLFFNAVVFWAIYGIYAKRSNSDILPDSSVEAISVIGMVIIGIAILALAGKRLIFRKV